MVGAAQIDLGAAGRAGGREVAEVGEANVFGSSRHGCQRGDPGRRLDRWRAARGGWRSGRSGAVGSLPKVGDEGGTDGGADTFAMCGVALLSYLRSMVDGGQGMAYVL